MSAVADPVLLELFRAELDTHTRVLEEGLIRAEAEQWPDKLEPLMRAAHSIKGAARMLGLDSAVRLAHAMEDVLVAAQRGTRRLTTGSVDLLLRGNDVFLRAAALAPAAIPGELDKQAATIDITVAELSAPPVAGERPASVASSQEAKPTAAPQSAPSFDEKAVRVTAQSLNRLVGLAGECMIQTRLARPLMAELQRLKQRQSAAAAGLERTLDLLREGDATGSRTELEQSLEQFREARDLVPKFLLEFGDWTRRLEVLIDPLYSEAVASRMRPFSDATHGYPRMVRDLARELGKQVHFEIEGASTPVDREILDRLESPITHLLRNAVDHGVEAPADRVERGKPPEARLVLSAHQVSGMLRIAVADDGAGIDIAALRAKVAAAGYASEPIARDLSESELLDFLFLPGFSTARNVTELSGRGVGLDVVHSAVRGAGGTIRIETKAGAGTTFELQLPLTLSIIRALVVEIAGEIYALPLTRVDRLVRAAPEELEILEDRQFCTVDGHHVGVLDARQVLNIRGDGRSPALNVIMISDRLSRYGLAVDRFLGERDLVVKPLPTCLGKVANVSAGAVLDDGTPLLILDADDLVRSMDNLLTQGALRKITAPAEAARPRPRRRVLVVDDSLTVREVERRLLENDGYEVTVAVDGMDGWNALQRASFDLLVTDVDMPRMDGLELVRRVRAAPRLATLPVVIVSYKEQSEYRIKGMEAGANYYLTKGSFHDESLVGAVRDLVGEA